MVKWKIKIIFVYFVIGIFHGKQRRVLLPANYRRKRLILAKTARL